MHPVFPGLSGALRFGVHNNNLRNGCRALVERVFLREDNGNLIPPPPCVEDVNKTLEEFKAAVITRVGVHRRWSVDKFVNSYTGRRQNVYARAAKSLETTPVHTGDFKVMNAFVKAEKTNLTSKPDPAPRVIQPRNPRYNVEVGRFLKGLEHKVYKAVEDIFGDPTVMKGYNAEEVAEHMVSKWQSFSDPVAVGLDASRFDQHVRPSMLEWEHSVYAGCFSTGEAKLLKWLLQGQIRNVCTMRVTDGLVKYRVDGSRMSGDMNTALGNCLIMCALVWRLGKVLGIRLKLANNGDDCVVFMERKDLTAFNNKVKGFFLDYGFTMKVEAPSFFIEQIEFCQAKPVWDGCKWIMVRDPRVCTSKDATCVVKDYGYGSAASYWLGAVGECGLAMAGGIPVMQNYYSAFARFGNTNRQVQCVTETGMAYLARGLHREATVISADARVSFWRAFGIAPTQQRELEKWCDNTSLTLPNSPCIRAYPPRGILPLL
ncbi:hypothetical protein 2 [Changjiang tombus-like virus 6]|uniref:hypothetical protein 2 n=1 Tax=Changjiang tombus-like virus 6 TaxID=1922820 RepID=UPI00090B618C|nr:hypothetical protein 2 [Changjiang tombus-like virus 6]APG76262.1 hypothetical protein 2 [Changjiang tombus-like virus 6]